MAGEVVATQNVAAGPRQRFSRTISIEASSWIAARTLMVQTGAIYLLVGGRPIRASERDAQYYVDYIDHLIAQIDERVFLSHLSGDISQEEYWRDVEEAKPRYRQAQAIFAQRVAEARAEQNR